MACQDCDENSATLPIGPTGSAGANGEDGSNGASFLVGAGAPDAGLGVIGDSYLNTVTYNLYNKFFSTWLLVGNLKGTNGSGLVKFAQDVVNPTLTAGGFIVTILGTLLTSYGFPTTSAPGVLSPPPGYNYGSELTDIIVSVYEYLPSTTTWQRIPDARNVVQINSAGDINIHTTGFTSSPNRLRHVLIG